MVVESEKVPFDGIHFQTAGGENATEAATHFRGFSLYHFGVTARRPLKTLMQLERNVFMLRISLGGVALVRSIDRPSHRVSTPGGIVLALGPNQITATLARGMHDIYYLVWKGEAMRALSDWIERRAAALQRRIFVTSLPSRGIGNWEDLRRIQKSGKDADKLEGQGLTLISQLLTEIGEGKERIHLADRPHELSTALEKLIVEVRRAPSNSWSLDDAARVTGYSPFHVSRVFRASFGYGFPEFVERVRTEDAVNKILETDKDLEVIAKEAGYRTVNALRSALKSYLGFLPSELKPNAGGNAIVNLS